jgi:hypothetical protein
MTPSHLYTVHFETTRVLGFTVPPVAHSTELYASDRNDAVGFVKHNWRHGKPTIVSARRVTDGKQFNVTDDMTINTLLRDIFGE